jgi:hypothetical protein
VNKTLKVVGGAGVTGNMTVAGDIGNRRCECGWKYERGGERAINVWVECGAAGSYQGDDGINRHNLALVVAGGAGVSGNVNMGNLSVVGDIDTTGDLILIRMRVIRWNSKQQFYIQDYFAADNRFGFCNWGTDR